MHKFITLQLQMEKKTYEVTIRQIDYYSYEVEAEDEEEAMQLGQEEHDKALEEGTLEAIDGDMEITVYKQ